MQWLKLDSLVSDHPKVLALDDPQALLLWVMTLVGCSKHETDGRIEPHMLRRFANDAYVATPAKVRAATRKIVKRRLWHDSTTIADCDACVSEFGEIAKDELVVHNWADHNPTKGDKTNETQAFKANRARQLRKLKTLKEQIRLRDRDYCRYCGIRVNMNDRISDIGGQLDHVDPDGPNSLENLVRSCRGCNMWRKAERTPGEAGMRMLPPPERGIAPTIPAWRHGADPFGREPGNKPAYPNQDPSENEPPSIDIQTGETMPTTDPTPTNPTSETETTRKADTRPDTEHRLDPVPSTAQPHQNQVVDPVPTSAKPHEKQCSDQIPPSRSARVGSEPGRNRVGPLVGIGSGTGSEPGSAGLGPAPVRLGMGRVAPGGSGAGLLGAARDGDGSVPPSRSDPPQPDPVELVENAFDITSEPESEKP